MKSTDVSVIICAYTEARWDDLIAAVESVRSQSAPPREIIVVIDHNPSLMARARAGLQGVTVIENDGLRGASGSKNAGVATATGSIVAFVDDDAAVMPDWLEQLVIEFDNPDVAGVGGLTEPKWTGEKPPWFPEEFYWVVGCTHRGMPETTAPVRNLIACNMAVRRQVFDEIGGFRSGIGPMGGRALGCEETEFCIRLNQHRREMVWLHKPQARAYHHVPAGRATWRYFLRRCYGEGQSKTLVTRFVGAGDALASERTYTLRTLPRGVARGLADAIQHGDLVGLERACAIVVGLTMTTMGYLAGLIHAVPESTPIAR